MLGYGQASELDGYHFSPEMQGIGCTVIDGGPGNGRGFLINAGAITPVGP